MSKRFIDNSILPKSFRKLNPSLKLAWYYIWNNCDPAGVWEIDEDLFEFENGFDLDLENLEKNLGDLLEISHEKELILIKDFIAINQCDLQKLNSDYNPHKPVFRALLKNDVKLNPSLNQASLKLVVGVVVGVEVEDKEKGGVGEKTEKSKPKKIKIPTEEEFIEYAFANEVQADESKVRLKYRAWQEAGWKSGKKLTPIKNWKTTLLNTLPYLKSDRNGKSEPTINRQSAETIKQNSQGW
tara:strand:+ start:294 stop:1016 length:723 start_codon:yes stop_codon:yes gene_type:complete